MERGEAAGGRNRKRVWRVEGETGWRIEGERGGERIMVLGVVSDRLVRPSGALCVTAAGGKWSGAA